MKTCLLYNLTRFSYTKALEWQLNLHSKVVAGEIDAALMLLEHDPVITIGVKGTRANIVADSDSLRRRGVEVYSVDRGGDVTFHGPGQLVGYPIISLADVGMDVTTYVRALEETIINTLAEFGIIGYRNPPAGVWVGSKKVCSIGIAVRKRVTYHGFALNINPDMSFFRLINPCGLDASVMTSMAEHLLQPPASDLVRRVYLKKFTQVFPYRFYMTTRFPC